MATSTGAIDRGCAKLLGGTIFSRAVSRRRWSFCAPWSSGVDEWLLWIARLSP